MNAVLATIDERTAAKVADDVRDYGHGYLRVGRDGRLEHVPSYLVIEPAPVESRGPRRT